MTERADDRDLAERDARVAWHPFTQHGAGEAPLVATAARDAEIVLADGHVVVDAISSWWACLHGHGRREIVDAVAAQAARLDHVLFAGATHAPAVDVAERLLGLAPRGLERVFFSDDGSTSVEVAAKMAVQAHAQRGRGARTRFIAFDGGYHGDTVGAMSMGDPEPFFRAFRPLLFPVTRVPVDAAALDAALESDGDRVAAVVLEPLVQGAGGMRMHPPEFVTAARDACTRAGAFLILDEVMTGFGRTGSAFASTKCGVTPDFLCVAKGLTGGTLPLAATLTTAEVFDAFRSTDRARTFFHGHTFTANPIACAAARASLVLFDRERTWERLDAIGRRIEARLRERAPRRTRALRRTGGIVAFDLAVDESDARYVSELGPRLRLAALERGVLLRPLGNVVYAMPPSCTTDAQCDRIAHAMADLAEL